MGAAAIFPAIMMAGAALSAAGAIQRGNQEKAMAQYNAQLKERDATLATQQASQEAQQVRWASARAQGSLLAGYGASGVTTDTGSPLDVLANSASQAALDEQTVLWNGKIKATGYQSGAALDRVSGKNAVQQEQLQAASYLVGGVGQSGYAYTRAGGARDAESPGTTSAAIRTTGYESKNWYA